MSMSDLPGICTQRQRMAGVMVEGTHESHVKTTIYLIVEKFDKFDEWLAIYQIFSFLLIFLQ